MSDDSQVTLDAEVVDDTLEDLERAMKFGELSLSHDEVRPSTATLARATRDAYETLVEAHPGYDLTEGADGE